MRNKNNEPVRQFVEILENNLPFGITGYIYQEILQGAESSKDFDRLVEYLGSQRFFHPLDHIQTYEAAAKIYFVCRRKGLTIRSSVDCFIAQIAIEQNLILLHNDKDYLLIKRVNSKLKLLNE